MLRCCGFMKHIVRCCYDGCVVVMMVGYSVKSVVRTLYRRRWERPLYGVRRRIRSVRTLRLLRIVYFVASEMSTRWTDEQTNKDLAAIRFVSYMYIMIYSSRVCCVVPRNESERIRMVRRRFVRVCAIVQLEMSDGSGICIIWFGTYT